MGVSTASQLVLAVLLAWAALHQHMRAQEVPACEMTYVYPSYERVTDPELHVPAAAQRYRLYKFQDTGVQKTMKDSRGWVIPALFIPGNAGAYEMARALASEVQRQVAHMMGTRKVEVAWYLADFRSDLAAFNGNLLEAQVQFTQEAIRYAASRHGLFQQQPSGASDGAAAAAARRGLLVVGHSYGGLVGRAAIARGASPLSSTRGVGDVVSLLVTLASPHQRPPLPAHPSLAHFYESLPGGGNATAAAAEGRGVPLLSLDGGWADMQVSQLLANPRGALHAASDEAAGASKPLYVHVSADQVPGAWAPTRHNDMVWCNQQVVRLARMLVGVAQGYVPGFEQAKGSRGGSGGSSSSDGNGSEGGESKRADGVEVEEDAARVAHHVQALVQDAGQRSLALLLGGMGGAGSSEGSKHRGVHQHQHQQPLDGDAQGGAEGSSTKGVGPSLEALLQVAVPLPLPGAPQTGEQQQQEHHAGQGSEVLMPEGLRCSGPNLAWYKQYSEPRAMSGAVRWVGAKHIKGVPTTGRLLTWRPAAADTLRPSAGRDTALVLLVSGVRRCEEFRVWLTDAGSSQARASALGSAKSAPQQDSDGSSSGGEGGDRIMAEAASAAAAADAAAAKARQEAEGVEAEVTALLAAPLPTLARPGRWAVRNNSLWQDIMAGIDYTNRTAWLIVLPPALLTRTSLVTLWLGQPAHADSFALLAQTMSYSALPLAPPLMPLPFAAPYPRHLLRQMRPPQLGWLLGSGALHTPLAHASTQAPAPTTDAPDGTADEEGAGAGAGAGAVTASQGPLVPLSLPWQDASSPAGALVRALGLGKGLTMYLQRLGPVTDKPAASSRGRKGKGKGKGRGGSADVVKGGSCLEPTVLLRLPSGQLHVSANATAVGLAQCFQATAAAAGAGASSSAPCMAFALLDPGCQYRVWVGPGLGTGYLQQLLLNNVGSVWALAQALVLLRIVAAVAGAPSSASSVTALPYLAAPTAFLAAGAAVAAAAWAAHPSSATPAQQLLLTLLRLLGFGQPSLSRLSGLASVVKSAVAHSGGVGSLGLSGASTLASYAYEVLLASPLDVLLVTAAAALSVTLVAWLLGAAAALLAWLTWAVLLPLRLPRMLASALLRRTSQPRGGARSARSTTPPSPPPWSWSMVALAIIAACHIHAGLGLTAAVLLLLRTLQGKGRDGSGSSSGSGSSAHGTLKLWALFHGCGAVMLLPSLAATFKPLTREVLVKHGPSVARAVRAVLLPGSAAVSASGGAQAAGAVLLAAMQRPMDKARHILAVAGGAFGADASGRGPAGLEAVGWLMRDDGAWLLLAALHCVWLAWRSSCQAAAQQPQASSASAKDGKKATVRFNARDKGWSVGKLYLCLKLWFWAVVLVMAACVHDPFPAYRVQAFVVGVHALASLMHS